MGKYTLNLSVKAVKDLKAIYKSGDQSSIKRIEQIFVELAIRQEKELASRKC